MLLLSLKNAYQSFLLESEDSGEVWKLFCGLQNKLPKALLFNGANHERFELPITSSLQTIRLLRFYSICRKKQNKTKQKTTITNQNKKQNKGKNELINE